MKPSEHPIPPRMKHLKLDDRGYPIFYIALIDKAGEAHLAINNTMKKIQCLRLGLCGICGTKLSRGTWFIGGPMSAFHPNGVFADPPMHHECSHYALEVCPWLCLTNYKRTEKGLLMKAKQGMVEDGRIQLENDTILIDDTQIGGRPDPFVAVMSIGYDYTKGTTAPYVIPKRPYRNVEFWRHGSKMDYDEGRAAVLAFLQGKDEYAGVQPTEIP